jgi:hypothetical protein
MLDGDWSSDVCSSDLWHVINSKVQLALGVKRKLREWSRGPA